MYLDTKIIGQMTGMEMDSDSTGESFMDENWNHIGSSWSDEWGSGFNFTVEELDSDGNVVSRTESGNILGKITKVLKKPEALSLSMMLTGT